MRSSIRSNCLTRVVIDDDYEMQIGQLQIAMERIQYSLRDIPPAQREYIANALLNVAVKRMLTAAGERRGSDKILLRD